MTRPVRHRSHALTQTADGNWCGWGSRGGAHMSAPSVNTYGCRDQHLCTCWKCVSVCVHTSCVCLLTHTHADCSLGQGWSSYGDSMGHVEGEFLLHGPLSCCRSPLDHFHLPSWPKLVLSAAWRMLHTHWVKLVCSASPWMAENDCCCCWLCVHLFVWMVNYSVKCFEWPFSVMDGLEEGWAQMLTTLGGQKRLFTPKKKNGSERTQRPRRRLE